MMEKREIMHNGIQRLTNTQIWEVIKSIVEPSNARKMKEILMESLYDLVEYQKNDSAQAIKDNFEGYIDKYITYKKPLLLAWTW